MGRLEGGKIGEATPVYVSYAYGTMRLDSVVLTADKTIVLRKGVPHVSIPAQPALSAGETRLANIWVTAQDRKLDLVVSEFVNDAGLNEAGVYQRYGRIRDEFKSIGAEWIILTPHYVRPDWMGLASQKEIDDDPRPYVKALRKFTAENGIALADGSLRYGRLWRQGIPYSTLLMNNINHPNPFGMGLFADALMALFPTANGL